MGKIKNSIKSKNDIYYFAPGDMYMKLNLLVINYLQKKR